MHPFSRSATGTHTTHTQVPPIIHVRCVLCVYIKNYNALAHSLLLLFGDTSRRRETLSNTTVTGNVTTTSSTYQSGFVIAILNKHNYIVCSPQFIFNASISLFSAHGNRVEYYNTHAYYMHVHRHICLDLSKHNRRILPSTLVTTAIDQDGSKTRDSKFLPHVVQIRDNVQNNIRIDLRE